MITLKTISLTFTAFAALTQIGFAQKEIPMPTEKGNITLLFTGFSQDSYSLVKIRGAIRNDTPFTLNAVSFEMIGYDESGTDVKECGTIIGCWFDVFDPISPGQVKSITFPGDTISLEPSRKIARTEFKILEASYFIKYDIQSDSVLNEKFTISSIFTTKGIGIDVHNKSSDVIEIAWDQSVYIDEDGSSSRVIKGNVNLAEKDRPQPNTVIPPGTRLQETVFPICRIEQDRKGRWVQTPILPNIAYIFDKDWFKRKKERNASWVPLYIPGSKLLTGKDVRLFLRLLVNDQKQNLTITFKIAEMIQ